MSKSQAFLTIIPAIFLMIFLFKSHFDLPMNYIKQRAEKKLRAWQRTNGTITSLKRGTGSRGTYPWKITYEFLDQNGNKFVKECTISGGSEITYSENSSIMVLFDKNNPVSCRTEMELSAVGFLDRKTGTLKTGESIRRSFLFDIAVVILTAIVVVIGDFTYSYTRGAGIIGYLFVLLISVGLGFLTARKFADI